MISLAATRGARRTRSAIVVGAFVVPLLACAGLSTVRDGLSAETSVLVLVLTVVGAAATGDRLAGIASAVSAAIWFDFFLTVPYLSFAIWDPDDIEATVLLVLISLAVTEVALWGQRHQRQAARRSGYLDGVLGAATTVAEGTTPFPAVVDVVGRQITSVLGASRCEYRQGQVRDPRIAVLDHEGVLTRGGNEVEVDRVGLPTDEYVALVVRRSSHAVGHFLVTSAGHVAYPTREQCRVAVLLADQVAVAALQDGQ